MARCLVPLLVAAFLSACATAADPLEGMPAPCGIKHAIEFGEANSELEACAADGNAAAQAQLGMLYLGASSATPDRYDPALYGFDESLSRDEALARGRRLIESAAEQGDAIAQNELGLAYLDGDWDYEVNEALALQWLRAATENGDALAPANLARMYFAGRGVERAWEQAEALLRLSAERGYKAGRCSLARWLDQYNDERRRAEARRLRRDAARDDHGFECVDADLIDDLPLVEAGQTT